VQAHCGPFADSSLFHLMPTAAFARAAQLIQQADALIVTAGAGMGVDSGLPDFRSNNGFWRAYPALGQLGISFSEAASPATFERDPHLAWGFYGHRLQLYRNTQPVGRYEKQDAGIPGKIGLSLCF
jgi:NAD-dependent SIR2 family protein deacetylase